MAMLKPKLKLKMNKATDAKEGRISEMHNAVERQRKSELQMDRQIAKRGRDGYR